MHHDPLFQERLNKLEKLRALGVNPYPERYERTHTSAAAAELAGQGVREVEEIMKKGHADVKLSGRLLSRREFGKLTFGHLLDDAGKIQICFVTDSLSEKEEAIIKLLDIGDFIGVTGELFKTKHGEITLLVSGLTFLGKSLRPLPEKWHGIQDQETKYRQRYLDMIMNRETRERFDTRAKVVQKLREFYWQKGFSEVDTPVLENVASGTNAKPFVTHHNALDMDVYLRIAGGEIWHKMLIVGGMEKVFEVARVFRNEGMDPSHLQEFTMIEHYAAYWNFEDNMRFTEEMLSHVIKALTGGTVITVKDRDGNPVEVDFKTPWPRLNYREMILKDSGIDILEHKDEHTLLKAIREKKITIEGDDKLGYGNLVDHLYKKVSRPKLIQPAFVIRHPADTKPLARRNDDDPRLCDTFQLLVNTWEIVNAYSELVDPMDQRKRFETQMAAKAKGDEEAMPLNEEYLLAMEHGMPPISGWGLGIDRLVTLLTQQENLRDVVLFPLMRPTKHSVVPAEAGTYAGPVSTDPRVKPEDDINVGLSYPDAVKLFDLHVKNPAIRNHSRESEAVMRALAKHFGANEEAWGILGLLHDIDWDPDTTPMHEHGVKSPAMLKAGGMSDEAIAVIQSHVFQAKGGSFEDQVRTTALQHALAAGETVTGLIHASALVRPDKKIAGAEAKSVKKKFKDKAFAAGVNRDVLMEIEKTGLGIDEFLELALNAIKGIAEQVGL